MVFQGKETVSTKIIINYEIIEQGSHFSHMVYNGYSKHYDTDTKVGKLWTVCGTIN